MSEEGKDRPERIRQLNDSFRTTFQGGRFIMTESVRCLRPDRLLRLIHAVRKFDSFTEDNDPHREHDFGAIEDEGEKFFWKIDYYDAALEYGSEDPTDPAVTTRVLTLMRAEEY